MQFTLIARNFTNRWNNGVVSWSSDVILHRLYFRKLYTIKISENDRQKLALFVTNIRIWPNRSINIRIYSETVDKWLSIRVLSLIWHMTCFGLYYRPDCTMWAVQTSTNARFADGHPARPLHSSNLRCLDLCYKRLIAHKTEAGGAVYPSVVWNSFPQLCSIHRRALINRLVCDDSFSEICNTFIRTSHTLTIHQYQYFSPCSNSISAHCINQTNATSGLDPVTFFKISLRYYQWSISNKNLQNWYWPPHIYHG